MTEFATICGDGEYSLNFKTDKFEHYKYMQECARNCVDHKLGVDTEQYRSLIKLLMAFPQSFINRNCEFIAHRRSNQYFILHNCQSVLDIKCKVLEWFSRPAHKTAPFDKESDNKALHEFMLRGINEFLDTSFTEQDMELIYTYLGNACHHSLTVQFVESGYDMQLLKERDKRCSTA